MNLELLRTFVTVHRAGSLTKAAAHLGLSQPTVTVQVRTLEEKLGKQLFVRRSVGVTPTSAADELAGELALHLDAVDDVVDRLLGTGASDRTLHLAGPAELTTAKVIPALASLIGSGMRVRTSFGLPDQLIESLIAGDHDLVVSTVRPDQPGLTVEPLLDEEYVLVAGPQWASEDVEQIPLAADAEEPELVRRYWATVFNRRPPMRAALVVPDLQAVRAAVIAGAGMGVLPAYLVAEAIECGELVRLHDPLIAPKNKVYLVSRAGHCQPQVKLARCQLMSQAEKW